MIMLVALVMVAVLGAVLCVLFALSEDPANGYRARHRAEQPSRAARASSYLRLRLGQAKRAAFLALVVVPQTAAVETSWIAELADTEASGELDRPGLGGAGRYAHLRTEELDSTAERQYRLAELGIRPPSPWGTPEIEDSWGPEPALVGAA